MFPAPTGARFTRGGSKTTLAPTLRDYNEGTPRTPRRLAGTLPTTTGTATHAKGRSAEGADSVASGLPLASTPSTRERNRAPRCDCAQDG